MALRQPALNTAPGESTGRPERRHLYTALPQAEKWEALSLAGLARPLPRPKHPPHPACPVLASKYSFSTLAQGMCTACGLCRGAGPPRKGKGWFAVREQCAQGLHQFLVHLSCALQVPPELATDSRFPEEEAGQRRWGCRAAVLEHTAVGLGYSSSHRK